MNSILQSCQPRQDLISGSFNPEVFTASLRQVIGHYRGDVKVKTTYTDAEIFFGEATSPTHGMRRVADAGREPAEQIDCPVALPQQESPAIGDDATSSRRSEREKRMPDVIQCVMNWSIGV